MTVFNRENEVYLLPGDFYFGDKEMRISTLLGSCIAITLWHPEKLIGGMCHYMLPSPASRIKSPQLDGKYAEDAIKMFLQEVQGANTHPSEYHAKVFGGGNMFPKIVDSSECIMNKPRCFESLTCKKVSCRNTLIGSHLLKENGFKVVNFDLGGVAHRKVIFEIANGNVWVRKGK